MVLGMSFTQETSEKDFLMSELRAEVEKLLCTQNLSEEEKASILHSALSIIDAAER
jgi:hypothetical protein